MNESAKKFLERAAYVVFFLAAVFTVSRVSKERNKPMPAPAPVSAEEAERARKLEELRKKMADFDAKQAASHAARVKRLGKAEAKAQEDRCDAELMKAFESAAAYKKINPSDTPDCGDN